MRNENLDRENRLFIQVLEKGIDVLRSFTAQRKTMTLREIAAATDLHKSSVHRVIYSLESMGYIEKHPKTGRFQLTPKVMSIGYNYLAADSLVDVANPFLAELTKTTGETTNLLEPSDDDMVYVARFSSHRHIPIHMPIGCRVPMFCTASGRAHLAALSEQACSALIDRFIFVQHTPRTVTNAIHLKKEIEQVRIDGYALNEEELFPGDMTIAAAIIGSQGEPIAAINLVTPPSRWTPPAVRQELLPHMLECARSISNAVRAFN